MWHRRGQKPHRRHALLIRHYVELTTLARHSRLEGQFNRSINPAGAWPTKSLKFFLTQTHPFEFVPLPQHMDVQLFRISARVRHGKQQFARLKCLFAGLPGSTEPSEQKNDLSSMNRLVPLFLPTADEDNLSSCER